MPLTRTKKVYQAVSTLWGKYYQIVIKITRKNSIIIEKAKNCLIVLRSQELLFIWNNLMEIGELIEPGYILSKTHIQYSMSRTDKLDKEWNTVIQTPFHLKPLGGQAIRNSPHLYGKQWGWYIPKNIATISS